MKKGEIFLQISLYMILLCFFIYLNSYAEISEKKGAAVLRSLTNVFSFLPEGQSPIGGTKRGEVISEIPMEKVEDLEIREIRRLIIFSNLEEEIEIYKKGKQRIIIISDDVLFDEQYKIKTKVFPFLKKMCKILSKSQYSIKIEGHTDNISNPNFPNNFEFSAFKALRLLKFFINIGNINPHRLSAFGYGEYRPLVPNNSPEDSGKNNRIQIILCTKEETDLKKINALRKPPTIFRFKNFIFKIFGGERL